MTACSAVRTMVSNNEPLLCNQPHLTNPSIQPRLKLGILAMGESEMKSAYMIKEAEVYAQQLSEDEALERFWTSRLANLPKDN